MKAGEKNYLKESNGTKANCNANVTQVLKVTHLQYIQWNEKSKVLSGLSNATSTKIFRVILLS